MRAGQVVAAIIAALPHDGVAAFPELRAGNLDRAGGTESRRLDLWTIDTYPSSMYARDCWEVKCSRRDYLHELRAPEKRVLGMLLSNRFWFATPAGLVEPDEVPLDCGLVWVHGDAEPGVETVRAAPWRDVPPPTARFLAELARRTVDPSVSGFRGLITATERARAGLAVAEGERLRLDAERDVLRAEVERLRAARAALRADVE